MKFNIKAKREAKGISQEELAEKAGISRATLSNLEHNEEPVTNTATLSKIADALECPVSDLLIE